MTIGSGKFTTEFWLTMLANFVGALATSGLFDSTTTTYKALGIIAMVLSTVGYTASRTIVKSVALANPATTTTVTNNTDTAKLTTPAINLKSRII